MSEGLNKNYRVKTKKADDQSGYLEEKIVGSTSVTVTEEDGAVGKRLKIEAVSGDTGGIITKAHYDDNYDFSVSGDLGISFEINSSDVEIPDNCLFTAMVEVAVIASVDNVPITLSENLLGHFCKKSGNVFMLGFDRISSSEY